MDGPGCDSGGRIKGSKTGRTGVGSFRQEKCRRSPRILIDSVQCREETSFREAPRVEGVSFSVSGGASGIPGGFGQGSGETGIGTWKGERTSDRSRCRRRSDSVYSVYGDGVPETWSTRKKEICRSVEGVQNRGYGSGAISR